MSDDEQADPTRPERRRRGHLEWWQDPPSDAELADEFDLAMVLVPAVLFALALIWAVVA